MNDFYNAIQADKKTLDEKREALDKQYKIDKGNLAADGWYLEQNCFQYLSYFEPFYRIWKFKTFYTAMDIRGRCVVAEDSMWKLFQKITTGNPEWNLWSYTPWELGYIELFVPDEV